jgi:hypothetical protein
MSDLLHAPSSFQPKIDLIRTISGYFKADPTFADRLHDTITQAGGIDAAVACLPRISGLVGLSTWIDWAVACDTPHVPATLGPVIPLVELEFTYEYLMGDTTVIPPIILDEVLPWLQDIQDKGHMWRYDQCAAESIKAVLGCIRPDDYISSTRIKVPFSIDERVLHCIWDSKETDIQLLSRPWEQATFHQGFPVEFRVFKLPNEGWAACNYYVQRALPESFQADMDKAIELARAFDSDARAKGLPIPDQYSSDWILNTDGELKFLEAGPAFTFKGGSHPCCFHPHVLKAGRTLLAAEPGSQFFCPPHVQVLVDKVIEGQDPTSFDSDIPPHMLLTFAAIQGSVQAQECLLSLSK